MKVKRKGVLAALLAMVAALGVGVSLTGYRVGCRQARSRSAGPTTARATCRPSTIPRWRLRSSASSRSTPAAACSSRSSPATRRTTIPAKAKSCALSLLGQGANIIFTTCDVDYATPVVQEAINRGVLAIAPCIGTDQMGPKRFGAKGALAFSFGNVAQDEGSAMAQWAWAKGWKTAGTATNTLLVYFKSVVQAFEARFKQLGGKIVDHETYATGANNVQCGRQPAERQDGRRVRDRDVVRRAARVRDGHARARQQHADPQLVGRRRHLLGAEGRRHELLRRDVRLGVRR